MAEQPKTVRGKRGFLWWLSRVLIIVLILVVAILLVGAVAKANLKAKYPPPGQLVDVGGYQLHIDCQGNGSPTVILEAGLGDPSLVWAKVQPQIVATTRVCAYDRAGLGWSDVSPKSRTADTMVEELHTLLKNAGIEGPYVLVGHSTGGMLVRLFADTYPADVVGMVLVDAQHEDQFARLPESMQQAIKQTFGEGSQQLRVFRTIAATGIGAWVPAVASLADNPKLPSPARETYAALLVSDPKFLDAKFAEQDAIFESLDKVKAAHITSLGDIPLIVLYHSIADSSPPGMTPEEDHEWWLSLQTELAALSRQGKLVEVDQSGHYIQLDQPQAVIGAIQEVLAALQD